MPMAACISTSCGSAAPRAAVLRAAQRLPVVVRCPPSAVCRPSTRLAASSKAQNFPGSLVGTKSYVALEVAGLLLDLGIVDAAYSGDWSRIGAITTDTELLLQKVVWIIVAAHIGTGIASGVLAQRNGVEPLLPAIKGFLFGTFGLYEQMVYKPNKDT